MEEFKRPRSVPPEQETLRRAYRCLEAQGFGDVEYLGPCARKGWLRFSAVTRAGQTVDLSLLMGPGEKFELTIHG